ncbi:MAG TPA: DUF6689 family protein [Thermoanaerobaculia bacterium]|jgi:hypothetical protein|nr:DUF6689 family protein [Thermoanaerobaculia bacterium]
MKRILALFLFVLAAALPASADGLLPGLLGSGGTINLPFSLLGGLGGILTVSFDSVTGLNLPGLGVSVSLVSPLDPALRARFPSGVSVPLTFPVLVHIEPLLTGGLAFNGTTTVQLQTLTLLAPHNSPRMYAASDGGDFSDMTTSTHSINLGSSYRVIGTRGGFSEFLIVSDPRPVDSVITEKLDRLDQILADNGGAISAPVGADLAAELAAARAHVAAGNPAAAVTDLDAFLATVAQHSGTDIPDVWRAARDLTDVAGLLSAGAQTLQFSLRVKQGLAH